MINNLLLFDKRYKSHHDSTGLISKYVPSEKADKSSFEAMLEIKPDDRKKAIYVHTPYCDKICLLFTAQLFKSERQNILKRGPKNGGRNQD